MKRKVHSFVFTFGLVVSLLFFSQNMFAQTDRNPLLEFCTGTWCQWCPCGDFTIENLLVAHPNLIPLAYHGPAGQDPYSNFPGNNIIGLLGYTGYPTATVDRSSALGDYTTWTSKVNSRISVPATVSIDVQRSYNEVTGHLDAVINMTPLINLTGQFVYNVVLTEDSLIYDQVNNNACVTGGPNWQHDWVVRAMINGASGENVNTGSTWNSGDMITKTISYDIPLTYNPDKCNLVVFVYKQSSPLYMAEVQQAVQITLKSPDYVASMASYSPDIIGDKNTPGQYNTVLRNIGLMDDMYYINCTLDGPVNWTGGFTTVNGNFAFGETDSVQVASDDSTAMSITINPNGYSGSGEATLSYQSKNNPGTMGSVTVRFVTTTGINILVIDASGHGFGEFVLNSVGNVFSGSTGIVTRGALNPSAVLDDYQMIAWTSGIALPVFHPDEVNLLQNYLDNGGKLFINGQDIGADIFGSGGQSQFAQAFYNNYLHATFVGNGTSYLINGIPGDPITNGIQFVINDIYQRSPDNISPYDANASSIFKYLNGPNIAGIKAADATHKVVYFGFGFEQIPDAAIQDTLISRIINWAGVTPTAVPYSKNIPDNFSLEQNFPNPFNPSTTIRYSLTDEINVNITVYDILGREVAQLVNEKQPAGEYELHFNASSLASGTYIYKLSAGDFVSVKKMTLLK